MCVQYLVVAKHIQIRAIVSNTQEPILLTNLMFAKYLVVQNDIQILARWENMLKHTDTFLGHNFKTKKQVKTETVLFSKYHSHYYFILLHYTVYTFYAPIPSELLQSTNKIYKIMYHIIKNSSKQGVSIYNFCIQKLDITIMKLIMSKMFWPHRTIYLTLNNWFIL